MTTFSALPKMFGGWQRNDRVGFMPEKAARYSRREIKLGGSPGPILSVLLAAEASRVACSSMSFLSPGAHSDARL
jgi:hypothetical protein